MTCGGLSRGNRSRSRRYTLVIMQHLLLTAAGALLLCAPSFAQSVSPRYEVGFRAGAAQYAYVEDNPNTRAVLGLEACAFCGGRLALNGTYSHFRAPAPPSLYQAAELFTTGLRIQRRGRLSPFFDAGFAAGYSRFLRSYSSRSVTSAGLELAAGLAFRIGKGVYLRPQGRLAAMSESYLAGSAEVAVGWRF
jgi:hypothetical protein